VLKGRFDAWRSEMVAKHHCTYVRGNHRVWVDLAPATPGEEEGDRKRILRGVQWPSYTDPVLDGFRLDERLFRIVSAIIGPDIKQIINQMHWKTPGSQTQWRYHQDVRSRKPDSCFRDLFSSYLNMGIAVERCTDETGAMRVIPRSHLSRCDLGIEAVAEQMGIDGHAPGQTELEELLRRVGADPANLCTLELQPGDVGVWNPYVIHGGGLNTSADCYRSFYIQGFVTAANCDRGHLAWSDGVPQPLGEPVLIQLDNFRETLAEGGRYYPEHQGEASSLDRTIEREVADGKSTAKAMTTEMMAAAAESRKMNTVRD